MPWPGGHTTRSFRTKSQLGVDYREQNPTAGAPSTELFETDERSSGRYELISSK